MKKIKILIINLIFIAFILNDSFGAVKNKKEALNITSNTVEIFRDKKIINFTTNVKAVQDKFILYADKMVVNYKENKDKKIEIQTIEAMNNVKFINEKVTATGDDGLYNLLTNKITLKNNVRAIEKGIEVTAQEFEYNVLSGKTKIIGGKQKNERVTVILDDSKTIR